MRRFFCVLSVLLVTGLALATIAGAMDDQDLKEIQAAIEARGARWVADDNPIFRLSFEEQRRLCGALRESPENYQDHIRAIDGSAKTLPVALDWRDVGGLNYVTPIGDQANCGSCVVFGTLACLEARINITRERPGSDLDLSEQHAFSCGGGSCDHGWTSPQAAAYLEEFGVPMESCLPYTAVDDNCDQGCSDWESQARKVLDWGAIPNGSNAQNVEQIKLHLMDGPVIVSFTVWDDFMSYSSGVYQQTWGEVAGGHCVCMVGWDDADSSWICKNSWGPGWGEDGFFRIRMGHNEVGIEENMVWLTPEPPLAYVQVTNKVIEDEITGNGDGIPDADESFFFKMTLSNPQTWSSLSEIQGWLLSSDPRITLLNILAMFPDLPDGGTSTNISNPFNLQLADYIGITPILFNLLISGNCEGSGPFSTEIAVELPMTVDLAGWPAQTSAGVRCSPIMVWHHGGPRRLVAVDDGGRLHMWDHSGQEVLGFSYYARGGQVWGSVAMDDLDGDGHDEILFGSKNDTLYAFGYDGSPFFKRDMEAAIMATPTLADLNGDESPEIVLGTLGSQLHILTSQGQKFDPFPIVLGGTVMGDATVADLDGNGTMDVVVGASDGMIYAIDTQTGESLPGFPVGTEGVIWSSPVIADLDANGTKEIIVGSDDRKLYAVKSTGEILFTYSCGQAIRSSPAIADLNDNGKLDVIFTGNEGKVYAVSHQGHILSGWPYDTGKTLWSSPIVLDVDGDGALEVVLVVPGTELLHLEADGSWLMSLPIEAGGIAMSTPVAGDLDNDGDLEIAVGTPGGVSTWNYPTASNTNMPWPMYRGNARRTGYVGDVTTSLPDETPAEPSTPVEYALQQNYPNPFNPETTIRYALAEAGPVSLTIYNILGQEVISLVNGPQSAGTHTAIWNGLNAGERAVSSGLYFYRLQAGDYVQTRKMILMR